MKNHKTIEIVDMLSLMKAVTDVNNQFTGQVWWRGQANKKWNLTPSVFREEYDLGYEQNIIRRFMQRAIVRRSNFSLPINRIQWLYLMQHYRLPTRLLDWTESPLCASFFAIEDETVKDEDGCLYALSAYELNKNQFGFPGIFLSQKISDKLINKPFDEYADEQFKVAAIQPDEIDLRMMVQLSTFTLHGTGVSLDKIQENKSFLIKLIIPSKAKSTISRELKYLGIREF